MRHVLLAIPAHSSQVHVGTLSSIVQSLSELAVEGIAVTLEVWAGDSLLPHARNALVAKFLASQCDDIVFIDSDISWAPGSLVRLLKHDVDIVAGLYRFKRDDEDYPVNWLPTEELWAVNGLLEVLSIPMGFTRITRAAAQKMTDAFPDLAYTHSSAPELDCRCLFNVVFENGRFYGEDFAFCAKWTAMGGKIWVDPELTITHHGLKDYVGHVGKWLKNR